MPSKPIRNGIVSTCHSSDLIGGLVNERITTGPAPRYVKTRNNSATSSQNNTINKRPTSNQQIRQTLAKVVATSANAKSEEPSLIQRPTTALPSQPKPNLTAKKNYLSQKKAIEPGVKQTQCLTTPTTPRDDSDLTRESQLKDAKEQLIRHNRAKPAAGSQPNLEKMMTLIQNFQTLDADSQQ